MLNYFYFYSCICVPNPLKVFIGSKNIMKITTNGLQRKKKGITTK